MKNITRFAVSAVATMVSGYLSAQNPYLPLWEYIPDGEPYVFEDPDAPGHYRVYVYGSHDNLLQYYCGRDQVVWSAPVDNLADWRYDGVVFESKLDAKGNYLSPDSVGDVLYAPDILETKDASGRKVYYFYPNTQHNNRNSMVAKGYRPDGPFEVCNWSPDDPTKTVGPFAFDPAAFVDDDGRAYGYWGFEHSYAAELDPKTMATVKPGTKIIDGMIPGYKEDDTFRFFEASSIRKIKDKYVFIYSRWTKDGDFGLPESNYTLAYCYSNNPLGPWTYGGTIIDCRGRKRLADGSVIATATPNGNTHGSICQIDGKWWVFYHRQSGTNEYNRQAMVSPIEVEVVEGPDGYVKISEAEFTSEGFSVEGLSPFRCYPAGIACYFTGPTPAHAEYPNVVYSGSHTQEYRTSDVNMADPYADAVNRSYVVNNTDGSVVGYKYFNFTESYGMKDLTMILNYRNEPARGHVDVFIDYPSVEEGGTKIGSVDIPVGISQATSVVKLPTLGTYTGKHAIYLVFSSKVKDKSLFQLYEIGFDVRE